ncbi:MAG: DNA-directed RNA polymerase subunit omega [Lachnospiraceae bacterium]|nr:DNA-directed RNA polymerase subunit omega [Lachnospiraceae bacterium]
MLHPSYTDLMKVVNKDIEEGETKIVNSRYSIVLATSKRARQIINGDAPLVSTKPGEKPLSVAIDELNEGQLKIIAENTVEDTEVIPDVELESSKEE